METEPPNGTDEAVYASWQEAYYTALCGRYPADSERIGLGASHIWLYDLNLDGIPELLISYLGTVNSVIWHGYAYDDGAIADIEIPDGVLPIELTLYKNKQTGEYQWVAFGDFREGYGHYRHLAQFVDFSDFSDVKARTFWEYTEALSEEEGVPEGYSIYTYYDPYGDPSEMSLEEIEGKRQEVLDEYEYVPTIYLFSFVDKLLTDGYVLTEAKLDRDALMLFFEEWEIGKDSSIQFNARLSDDMPEYTFEVRKIGDEFGELPRFIYEVSIFEENDPDRPIQSFTYESAEKPDDNLVRFEDINFDGYQDLVLLFFRAASNENLSFYIWDTETNQFTYKFSLLSRNYELLSEGKRLHNYIHGSAPGGTHELYQWDNGGFILIRSAEVTYTDINGILRVTGNLTDFSNGGELVSDYEKLDPDEWGELFFR